MSQMKDQDKTTAKELNMPDEEFKIMVIKILTGFEKSGGSQTFNKDRKYEKEPIRDELSN